MRIPVRLLPALALLAAPFAGAQTAPARQDPAMLRQVVEQFLTTQSAGLPGEVSISVTPVDPRLNLAACVALEPFLPAGSRVWGKTTVGVRCSVPAPWTVYVSAMVQVNGQYVASAAPLAQGQTVQKADLTMMKGDLTALPAGILTDANQAVGRTVVASLKAGTPLRQDALRAQQAIQQGQVVRVVSGGAGFKVSAEAKALGNAADGQTVQARTQAGQVVSGTARMGGIVEVGY